jgi:hypothetical protein
LISVDAKTPSLAAAVAVQRRHGVDPDILVRAQWRIIGRCGRCKGFVYEGTASKSRRGELRCEDCP